MHRRCPWLCHFLEPAPVAKGKDITLHDDVQSCADFLARENGRNVSSMDLKPLCHDIEGVVCVYITVHADSISSEYDRVRGKGSLCLQTIQEV